jgi:hypothetical protein
MQENYKLHSKVLVGGGDEKKRKIHRKKWEDIAIPKCAGGMGFRDFQLFNQSMLAKQAWRLISNPDSLCARVLQGKYYHDSDLMSAKKKQNASNIWNAILYGREALRVGLIKRIGDGSSVRVWDDPWIPGNVNMKPITRDPEAEAIMVSDLIDHQAMTWDQEKLEANFVTADVVSIRGIPFSRFKDDFWSWTLERSGHFTVRSCYKALVSARMQSEDASSSGTDSSRSWIRLWKMDVPPKIRTFWWRVINGFIPCRQVLNKRHMEEIAFCESAEQNMSLFSMPSLSVRGRDNFGMS